MYLSKNETCCHTETFPLVLFPLSYHTTDSRRLSVKLHPFAAAPVQLGRKMNNVIVARKCQSIGLKHDRICESLGAAFSHALVGFFPVVFPACTI